MLEYLWADGGHDAKEVHRAVGRPRGITLNTIQSTLKRLFEKDLLEREKISHAHVYTPRLDRETFHRRALHEVVERLMGGESSALLSAFVSMTEEVGVDELERLESLVAERLRDRRGKEPR